ncbi:MAG: PKD domain-containing protein, partial [Candidatus Thermoplasmatota archaeon]
MHPLTFKKNKYTNILIISLFAILLVPSILFPVQALEHTIIRINPSTQAVSSGKSFIVNVHCIPGQRIKAFEFTINFNPTLLQATSVSEGDIFNGYRTFFNNGSIDNSKGVIDKIYGLILGPGSVSSSGTFVSISFTAKSTIGNSAITLKNVGITNNSGYIQTVVSEGNVQIIAANQPPLFTSLSTTNNSLNIPLTRNSLSVTIRDPEGNHFDYTIQTSPNVGRASINNAVNGTKTCSIAGLTPGTTYRWYVNATDGTHWARHWYRFTTTAALANTPLLLSSISPSNGSKAVPISTPTISLLIQGSEGKPFGYTIQTNPDIGDISVHAAKNGTKHCTISGLSYSTTYTWYVNTTDGITTIKKWFIFTTESEKTGGPSPDEGKDSNEGNPTDDHTTPSPIEQNHPPQAPKQPDGPTIIQPGVLYTFSCSASDPDEDSIRLLFDWGDNISSEWTALTPSNTTVNLTHSWTNISSYAITVLAQDEIGRYSNWSHPLIVTVTKQSSSVEPPPYSIRTPLNISANHTCHFNITGTIPFIGNNISYYWEFGDGTAATGKTPNHTYTNPGVYTVTLTTTDDFDNTDKKTITLAVPAYSEGTDEEKQSSWLPYAMIPMVAFLVFIIILVVRIYKKTTKTYSSKKHTHRQQKMHRPLHLTNELKSSIYTSYVEDKTSLIPSSYCFTEDVHKKIDDILQSRKIHEVADLLK